MKRRSLNVLPSMRDWYVQHGSEPVRPATQPMEGPAELPNVKTPCTVDDLKAIAVLARVTFVPATGPKRFARQIQGATELTAKQRDYLWLLVYRFRRQIADASLIAFASELKARAR